MEPWYSCSMLLDLVGKTYGRLTVIAKTDKPEGRKTRGSYWLCACSCGKNTVTSAAALRDGNAVSCGCFRNERISQGKTKHGYSMSKTGTPHPLYRVWETMKARCHRLNQKDWKYYGARGVSVCNEWRNSSVAFIEWALANGWEQGLTLDRRDNNGNYEPSNCRFVTRAVQAQNRRVTRVK